MPSRKRAPSRSGPGARPVGSPKVGDPTIDPILGTGMEIDGTMRHRWRFVGDEVAHFELFYDSPRMRAFYDLAAVEADR